MHNPTLIPTLLKDTSVNNGFIYRELRKALPCRIGIEFEMGKLFLDGFKNKYDTNADDDSMEAFYKVYEIRSDFSSSEDDKILETRISIKDYHQLSGLYRFMQDLPEFCLLHEGGGIHIHIDMSMFKLGRKIHEIQNYISKRLDIVGKLFPHYKGKYNNREVGIRRKATWVNISTKDTLEFRILPLTFDYYTLMIWIVGIVKFRNTLIHECKLVPIIQLRSKVALEKIGEIGEIEEIEETEEEADYPSSVRIISSTNNIVSSNIPTSRIRLNIR